MSVQAMADDTLALLAHLGIGQADLFGYSRPVLGSAMVSRDLLGGSAS
jgi:pimeloyl-ACP methyl ester carboxylesterase